MTLLRRIAALLPLLPLLAPLGGCAGLRHGQGSGADSLLWRIPGKTNSVYLLGSVHVLPKSAHPLPERFDRAFDDAERVVFEVDPRAASSGEAERALARHGYYPEGESLRDHVHPSTWRLLARCFDEIGIDPEKASRMKAWFLADILEGAAIEAAGYRFDLGVDSHYARLARQKGKPVGSLETAGDQSLLLAGIRDADAETRLLATLLHSDEIVRQIAELCRKWRRGDVGHVAEILRSHAGEDAAQHRAMFARRNRKWLPQIERFTRQRDDYLVVVGAGHLVGPEGLVELLRARGHAPEPLGSRPIRR